MHQRTPLQALRQLVACSDQMTVIGSKGFRSLLAWLLHYKPNCGEWGLFSEHSPLPLAKAIASTRKRAWSAEIIYIPCECNMMADPLAKMSTPDHYGVSMLDSAISDVISLVARDKSYPPHCS
ncbi:hypothetical protein F3Y22_tig00000340pilonHSYRG01529 [Hibiscus syriacus]|uniref:Uncharacterized protein n=1 Tax=Hibiscus syriacus TaxID=106335 RepID=A0A6A3D5D5_HIBSY|nr:hypothetical protein F3Y22_tig00000340pilonHSYRG01529 [Hibiscus syriacus]